MLCRKERVSGRPVATPEPVPSTEHPLRKFLPGLALLIVAAGGVAGLTVPKRTTPAATPSSAEPAASGTSESTAVSEPPIAGASGLKSEPKAPGSGVSKWKSETSVFVGGGRTGPVLDPASAARERAARAQREYEAWAHREAMAQVQEDIARARRSKDEFERGSRAQAADEAKRRVSITMYSASWCGVCSQARSYMAGAGIPFSERDVEKDPGAAAEALRLNPRGSVPTFDVNGSPIVGFSPRTLDQAIAAAGRR